MIRSIPIRISILTLFFFTVAVVAFSLIATQYHYSNRLADEAASKTFEETARSISQQIRTRDQKIRSVLDTAVYNGALADPVEPKRIHAARPFFISILEHDPALYAVYVGRSDGSFYEVANLVHAPGLIRRFDAPETSRWLVIKVFERDGRRIQTHEFLDASLKRVSERYETTLYNPASRIWYTDAVNTDLTIRTDPYLFTNLGAPGMTYSRALPGKSGVLAIDITTEHQNAFLASQDFIPGGELFFFDRDGEKTGSSTTAAAAAGTAPDTDTKAVFPLSDEERTFLEAHPVIRISNETDWAPFDFSVGGAPRGYSIDMLALLAQRSGIRFQYINGYNWRELMALFEKGDLDVIHSLYKDAHREAMGIFTDAMFGLKTRIITRKESGISKIGQLRGKRVAIPEGWSTVDYLKTHYPDIRIVTVPRTFEAYLAVSEGRAEATLDNAMTLHYLATKYHIDNLYDAGWFPEIDNGKEQRLYMLVQPSMAPLASILNKALATITDEERRALERRWLQGANVNNGLQGRALAVLSKEYREAVRNHPNTLVRYTDGGIEYFGYAATFDPTLGIPDRLGMIVPAKTILTPYTERVYTSLFIAVLLLLAAVPVVLYGTRLITDPIKRLMIENAKAEQRRYGEVRPIDSRIRELQELSHSMVSMTRAIQAYEKSQEELMDAFIKLIADAIDAKSPYTGGHCRRVPEIATRLAEVVSATQTGAFSSFTFETPEAWREFSMGAWLHDCGKITTPEYVVDKATKLETLYNRIHEVRMRFEVLWRDAELAYHRQLAEGEPPETLLPRLEAERARLVDDFAFVAACNLGGEHLDPQAQARLRKIGSRTWERHFDNRLGLSEEETRRFKDRAPASLPATEKLLDDRPEHRMERHGFDRNAYEAQGFKSDVPRYLYDYGELYNLCIERGTLTPEERFKINEHVIMTIKMLERLPLPEGMRRIPEYAGTHHETLVGTGYPRQLTGEALSVPARIMAIADIFEALTASDRPYKQGKTLSETLEIMEAMCEEAHIDRDLFTLFCDSGLHLEYARRHLRPEQIDLSRDAG